MSDPTYRPGPGGQLRYLLGGRLLGHVEWVRHDLTDAGWRWRVCGRTLLQLLPVVVVAVLLPLPGAELRVLMGLLVVLSWAMTVPPLAEPLRNRRLRQHGLPVPPARVPFG